MSHEPRTKRLAKREELQSHSNEEATITAPVIKHTTVMAINRTPYIPQFSSEDFELNMVGGFALPPSDLYNESYLLGDLSNEGVTTTTEQYTQKRIETTTLAPAEESHTEDSTSTVLCRSNFVWDKERGLCTRLVTSCPVGMFFDEETNKCQPGSDNSKECDPGFRYNAMLEECIGR